MSPDAAPTKSSEPQARARPDTTREVAGRLARVYRAAWSHNSPMRLEVIDTGGSHAGKRARYLRAREILREASLRIHELVGHQDEAPRDLGSYGQVWHDEVPVEFQVELEGIFREYCDRVDSWQRKCAHWRGKQAVTAEFERIVSEGIRDGGWATDAGGPAEMGATDKEGSAGAERNGLGAPRCAT